MSHVERVLWRIAELGARCSQHDAAGGRGPLWAELEETIGGLDAEFEAARQATDSAPAQVRSLEGRLKVALQERDREKARVKESCADADAARRERDRAILKARKAMAAAVEARNATAEARATATRSVARAEAAEAALDQAMAVRDRAVASLDEAIATGERAADARDAAARARDEAVRARDEAALALEGAQARIARLEAALDAARVAAENAASKPAVSNDAAVVVLPGVALPEPQAPAAPASRVSWKPTWSEWANPEGDDDDDVPVAPAAPTSRTTEIDLYADDMADADHAEDIVLDDSEVNEGDVRYLNVGATIGGLLPEDLSQFLLAGTTVVRREGRLYAVLAVRTPHWAPPGTGGAEQAEMFTDAGFKAEWTSNAHLGV